MSLKDVQPGRYKAKITDWGVEEVEQLGGEPKASIVFEFYPTEGTVESIKWDGFFKKTDGDINKKTVETLLTCGLQGDFLDLLPGGPGLDKEKELEITVIIDGEYHRVEWVNEPGGSAYIKKVEGQDIAKKLKGLSLNAGLKGGKPAVKNYAPGASNPPSVDENEEIPF